MQPEGAHALAHRLARLVEDRYRGNWAEAARACGVSTTGLQKIKDGGDPRASTLERLARGLGVSLDVLVLGATSVADDAGAYQYQSIENQDVRYRASTEEVLAAIERAGIRLPAGQIRGLIEFAASHHLPPAELDRLVSLIGAVDPLGR